MPLSSKRNETIAATSQDAVHAHLAGASGRNDAITYNLYCHSIEQSIKEKGDNPHWKNALARWNYHQAAAQLLQLVGIKQSDTVLEVGTMGVKIFAGSDTLDYSGGTADWPVYNPTFFHDARLLPWPVPSKRYDTFIALRVFQHLYPFQRECFLEAQRIARRALIVVPDHYETNIYKSSRGIDTKQFTSWNGGVAPSLSVTLADGMGTLHYWHYDRFGALKP